LKKYSEKIERSLIAAKYLLFHFVQAEPDSVVLQGRLDQTGNQAVQQPLFQLHIPDESLYIGKHLQSGFHNQQEIFLCILSWIQNWLQDRLWKNQCHAPALALAEKNADL
jgi:hypothetical protein